MESNLRDNDILKTMYKKSKYLNKERNSIAKVSGIRDSHLDNYIDPISLFSNSIEFL